MRNQMNRLKQFLKRNKSNPHLYLIGMWVILAIPTYLFWRESVLWVATMSLYANIEASFAALEAHNN